MANRIISRVKIGKLGNHEFPLTTPLRALSWAVIKRVAKFANRVMPGYVMPIGEKMELIVDHDGPASYLNGGGFTTHGEVINASDFGLGGFELVDEQSLSSDALNTALIWLQNQSTSVESVANALPTARIFWFVQATGVEVANAVNLSTKSLRLRIRGV